MGTRCGQIDPGVILYLLSERGLSVSAVSELLHRGSGLKGMSGISHDLREIEAANTEQAGHAIDYFVHRARREIGSLVAELGGLDALVFSGGIGEHAHEIRRRICEGFQWLGLELDPERNILAQETLSPPRSRVKVMIIPANEELTIARHVTRVAPMKA